MKRYIGLIAFYVVFIADLIIIAGGYDPLRYISKPLLLITLGAYFILNSRQSPGVFLRPMIAALFFSWLGDVLLLFDNRDPVFFLLGLSSFLIAHISYILFFAAIRQREQIKNRFILLLPVAVYYGLLMYILVPNLGSMDLPVRLYGAVICVMLVLALHLPRITPRPAGLWLIGGAVLFVISDSLLALNKFYRPFEGAGLAVMSTYGLAQLLLVKGALNYINDKKEIEANAKD